MYIILELAYSSIYKSKHDSYNLTVLFQYTAQVQYERRNELILLINEKNF